MQLSAQSPHHKSGFTGDKKRKYSEEKKEREGEKICAREGPEGDSKK